MTTKQLCLLGLLFFLISYLFFSKVLPDFQIPIDFAHWFNLIGACFLLSFNDVFPKNKLNFIASIVTALGVIAHIGLCTIDFIMWSFGNNEAAKEALSSQISNTPSILYPFVIIGPSLLFIGLAIHALNFFKTNTISAAMVIVGAVSIGFSFFILKNGIYMLLSCVFFVVGLGLLLYRTEIEKGDTKQKEFTKL
ncbi:hypothetical protein FLA105534_04891 [Flavobacterium bizetiae]|uniref:Uncharacterized protein n=1 Tax=Flavobacterium bizetiae TaxID=2704140 RepID=A0A6J4H093_9FLAO|nr:hypothetical protein [Flavobacterium bizetiae]CAA9203711.1 hypothetical protein FLA105534_04891 [Flavobacterium bizetiae]CAD5341797.1 hypothetical protein FLA105535_01773 [Flavobacterium bizetiae]CAD5347545.1 hypothetical protein FLA105534_01502 [Flavobacterium bizetiae]